MNELFVYGTLCDAEYRSALFGRDVAARPATLRGSRPVMAENGYLTLVHAPGETVDGELLALDDRELALADAWEDVPVYERLRIEAHDASGLAVAAFVYVRPTDARERAPAGHVAQHPRERVLAQIGAVRRDYARRKSESA